MFSILAFILAFSQNAPKSNTLTATTGMMSLTYGTLRINLVWPSEWLPSRTYMTHFGKSISMTSKPKRFIFKFKLLKSLFGPRPSPGRFWRGSSHFFVIGSLLKQTSARALHAGVQLTPFYRATNSFRPLFTFWRALWMPMLQNMK